MKRAALLVAFVACGPLSPPAPVTVLPPWHPRDVSDLRGHWAGGDRDNWGYDLKIHDDKFSLAIHRGDRGECTETGTLALGAHDDARAITPIVFTYATDTCNPSFAGASVTAYLHDGSAEWLDLDWPDAVVHLMNQHIELMINVPS